MGSPVPWEKDVCPFLSRSETLGQMNTKGQTNKQTWMYCNVKHIKKSACMPELLPYVHHSQENPFVCKKNVTVRKAPWNQGLF